MGVMDVPSVVQEKAGSPDSSVKFYAGDMFDADNIPEADVVILKCILHDWSDGDTEKILKNVHSSLAANGRVVIVESCIPDPGELEKDDSMALCMDMRMMTLGGKERSETRRKQLLEKAGFRVQEHNRYWTPIEGKIVCTVAATVHTNVF